jgi:RNA polymerase sigma-32 factor
MTTSDLSIINQLDYSSVEVINDQENVIVTRTGNSSNDRFLNYLRTIQKFNLLSKEEEEFHTKNYFTKHDSNSAKILIESHLRLVVKIANRFKNYGLPLIDLVSEGNLGLIQALKKFQPQKGFRFSTYAMWWIRAFIQDYVLRSWSLVKIGTTNAQRKLFFNLHKIKKKLGIEKNITAIDDNHLEKIARTLNVDTKEVKEMDSRMSQGDYSINYKISNDGDCIEVGELIPSEQISQEQIVIENQEYQHKKQIFNLAFASLNPREQDIIQKRQLAEDPITLDELSKFYKISRERIRQIEENAIKKIKREIANYPAN